MWADWFTSLVELNLKPFCMVYLLSLGMALVMYLPVSFLSRGLLARVPSAWTSCVLGCYLVELGLGESPCLGFGGLAGICFPPLFLPALWARGCVHPHWLTTSHSFSLSLLYFYLPGLLGPLLSTWCQPEAILQLTQTLLHWACWTPASSDSPEDFNTLLGASAKKCTSDQKESGMTAWWQDKKGCNSRWILASEVRSLQVLEFPSLTMCFLADILFVVITVVPLGMSSILQSKGSVLEELVINCIFIGDGGFYVTLRQNTLTASILVYDTWGPLCGLGTSVKLERRAEIDYWGAGPHESPVSQRLISSLLAIRVMLGKNYIGIKCSYSSSKHWKWK